jgi:hypothetical protein
LYALDYDDGVIHNEADGQYEAEHRERVDREAKQREEDERANKRYWNRQQGDERLAPILEKQIDDNDDQHDSDEKSLNDFFHALGDSAHLVERDRVFHVLRKALLHLRHQRSDGGGCFDSIGARRAVLSLIYADIEGFPPTLCMTSTRDHCFSGTLDFHRALLRTGSAAG